MSDRPHKTPLENHKTSLETIGSATMRTTRYGSGGPPLVLVHGLACDGSDWAAQVVAFEPRTTVIVCELPGHGSSPAIPADCTVGAYGAALVRDLIEQAVWPAILVGHSMGCRIVVEAYRVEPTIASGLVLMRRQPDRTPARSRSPWIASRSRCSLSKPRPWIPPANGLHCNRVRAHRGLI